MVNGLMIKEKGEFKSFPFFIIKIDTMNKILIKQDLQESIIKEIESAVPTILLCNDTTYLKDILKGYTHLIWVNNDTTEEEIEKDYSKKIICDYYYYNKISTLNYKTIVISYESLLFCNRRSLMNKEFTIFNTLKDRDNVEFWGFTFNKYSLAQCNTARIQEPYTIEANQRYKYTNSIIRAFKRGVVPSEKKIKADQLVIFINNVYSTNLLIEENQLEDVNIITSNSPQGTHKAKFTFYLTSDIHVSEISKDAVTVICDTMNNQYDTIRMFSTYNFLNSILKFTFNTVLYNKFISKSFVHIDIDKRIKESKDFIKLANSISSKIDIPLDYFVTIIDGMYTYNSSYELRARYLQQESTTIKSYTLKEQDYKLYNYFKMIHNFDNKEVLKDLYFDDEDLRPPINFIFDGFLEESISIIGYELVKNNHIYKIKEYIEDYKKLPLIKKDIYDTFKLGVFYTRTQVTEMLLLIVKRHNTNAFNDLKSTMILDYYKVHYQKRLVRIKSYSRNKSGYVLIRHL